MASATPKLLNRKYQNINPAPQAGGDSPSSRMQDIFQKGIVVASWKRTVFDLFGAQLN